MGTSLDGVIRGLLSENGPNGDKMANCIAELIVRRLILEADAEIKLLGDESEVAGASRGYITVAVALLSILGVYFLLKDKPKAGLR